MPQINVRGRPNRPFYTGPEADQDTKNENLFEAARQANTEQRMRQEDQMWKDHETRQKSYLSELKTVLRQEVSGHEAYIKNQQALAKQQEQNTRKWERIKLQDERRQQREVKSQETSRQKNIQFQERVSREQKRTERAAATWLNAQKTASNREQALDRQFQSRLQRENVRARRTGAAWSRAMSGAAYDQDYRDANEENAAFNRRANRPGFGGRMALGAARFVGGRKAEGVLGHLMGYGGGRGGGGGGGGGYRGGMGIGMNDFGELGAAGYLGAGAVIAGVAYEVSKKILTTPQTYAGVLSGLQGSAQPYWNLRQGTANIGRMGNFGGNALASAFYPGHGITPDWMLRTGATAEGAMGVLGAYGLPVNSTEEGVGIARRSYEASMAPYLGGLAPGKYAQSFGQYKTRGGQGSQDEYNRQLQKIMYGATLQSLDHSQVLSNIEDLIRMQTSLGYATPNVGATGAMWYRMASSGAPSARTGEMQASLLQNTAQKAQGAGYGGDPALNVMLHTAFSRTGGIPKSKDDLAKRLGINYADMDAPHKQLFDAAVDAANKGDEASLYSLLGQGGFLTPDSMQKLGAASGLIPSSGYGRYIVGPAYTGATPLQQAALDTGGQLPYLPNETNRVKQAHDFFRSQGYNETATDAVLGYLRGESGDANLNPRAFNGKGGGEGARGAGQWRGIRIVRFRQMFGHNPDDPNVPADQLFNEQLQYMNWELHNTERKSGVMLENATPGTARETGTAFSLSYGRGGDYAAGQEGAFASGYGQLYGQDQNTVPDINPPQATIGQAQTDAAKQTSDFLSALNETVIPSFSKFSSSVTDFSGAVERFVASIGGAGSSNGTTHAEQYRLMKEGKITAPTTSHAMNPNVGRGLSVPVRP